MVRNRPLGTIVVIGDVGRHVLKFNRISKWTTSFPVDLLAGARGKRPCETYVVIQGVLMTFSFSGVPKRQYETAYRKLSRGGEDE